MPKLSLSRAWDETRAVLARDGKLFVAVALALFFLPGTIAGVVHPGSNGLPQTASEALLFAIVAIIGLIGQLAVIRLALGPKLTVGEAIGHGVRRAPIYFAATVIWLAPLAIIAFLIAGPAFESPQDPPPMAALGALVMVPIILFFLIRMLMTSTVASAEKVGPIGILQRSWALTRGQWWRLFGFFLLLILVMLIVMAAVGAVVGILTAVLFGEVEPMSIGALFVAAVTQLASALITIGFLVMLTRLYVQLAGPAEVSVPTSGT